ncbi:MAG: helix-turn-helix domain-containing protein, partial [Treponema sp.]|nr:helix-turn-helix domain-containing protein [Treponema sp.]
SYLFMVYADLRAILSQNIKNARKSLSITREKLAEYAEISVPYLGDIERRRTWVSDKTLQNLAKALDVKPWELLVPVTDRMETKTGEEDRKRRIAELIAKKKEILHRTAGEAMEDLIMQILEEP